MANQKQLKKVEFTEIVPSGFVVRKVNNVAPEDDSGAITIPVDLPPCAIELLSTTASQAEIIAKVNEIIKWLKNETNK